MDIYATIKLELTKAGIYAHCDDLDKDVFIPAGKDEKGGDLSPLVELINDAETYCNPDTIFKLTENGKRLAARLRKNRN
jgi:hypothetical protein